MKGAGEPASAGRGRAKRPWVSTATYRSLVPVLFLVFLLSDALRGLARPRKPAPGPMSQRGEKA